MDLVTQKALEFKRKYPSTVAWRIRSHARIISNYLNPGEEVKYVFAGQKNDAWYDMISSCVVAITNKRLVIGIKRVFFGYFFTSITPDLFNDLEIKAGLLWGKVYIDTIGELVVLSNVSKRALDEIETQVTENMIREKKKYMQREVR